VTAAAYRVETDGGESLAHTPAGLLETVAGAGDVRQPAPYNGSRAAALEDELMIRWITRLRRSGALVPSDAVVRGLAGAKGTRGGAMRAACAYLRAR
jgi:hypothetical protein